MNYCETWLAAIPIHDFISYIGNSNYSCYFWKRNEMILFQDLEEVQAMVPPNIQSKRKRSLTDAQLEVG